MPYNELDSHAASAMTSFAGLTAFETYGEGPDVVLIHGLGLNRQMWRWQLGAFTPHFRVVSYDLLGHGESDKPRGRYLMHHMVDQLSDLMDELDIERAAIVGFSLGGLIARAFALARPRRTAALVILSSAHDRTAGQRASIMARARQVQLSGPESIVDDALKRWFSDVFSTANPQVMNQVRRWVTANDRGIYPAVYRLLAEGDIGLEKEIENIGCPALVITGEQDSGNTPQMAKQMSARIPGARCVILPGLRHMALIEDPEAVNNLLVPFLIENLSVGPVP